MVDKSADEVAKTWADRLSASTERIRANVDKVTTAPSAQAVAKKDKMKANLIASIDNGKWGRRLGGYSLSAWQNDMKTKAVNRIPEGARAAQSDFQTFIGDMMVYQKSGQAQIAAMPDISLEDSINRASAWIRHMSKYQRK